MAYQVLSRKWRPQTFEDVAGQEHITRSLRGAILRDRLGHAYLFTGTRGIGKTSVARLFAKALRCLNPTPQGNPCNECDSCADFNSGSSMNIFEIDGASNNSVDDVRNLVSNIQTLPTIGKYKIYIIDEVHMLSSSAFNALLKTLEEPPRHVIFMLATTEPEKLLSTVLSRCQRFDFRTASLESLVAHVKKIAENEKIEFEKESLIEIICRQGHGSFRDTLSRLDQVLSFCDGQYVSEDSVTMALGLASSSATRTMLQGILSGKVRKVTDSFSVMLTENVSLEDISHAVIDGLFELIQNIDEIEKVDPSLRESVSDISFQELFWVFENINKDLTWALGSISPEKMVLVTLQKIASRREIFSKEGTPLKKESLNKEEVAEKKKDKPAPVKKLSWDDFLETIAREAPAISAHLEHGNLKHPVEFAPEKDLKVEIAFKPDASLFYEHFQSDQSVQKITTLLSEYAQVSQEKVHVQVELLKDETQDFLSKAEIREKERLQELESKKEKFVNEPLIKKAEELFNSKLDKIKIN